MYAELGKLIAAGKGDLKIQFCKPAPLWSMDYYDIRCVGMDTESNIVMLSEKTLFAPVEDIPTELIKDLKAATFGVRYGATRKRIEDYDKELVETLGHSPDKQDAVASTYFIADSLASLEK